MCTPQYCLYSQCGHTVFAGWDHCATGQGTACPHLQAARTNPVAGECPDCIYGTPDSNECELAQVVARRGNCCRGA
jgi:hypothetical protein